MTAMPSHEPDQTAEDRVPWSQLVAYGMGGLVPIALFNIAPQLIGLLGNISLGLSAVWLGAIMVVARLWDAFSDPIMGHISDNTRSRWGRRRPYILLGGIAVSLTFVAMWWVPRGDWIRDIFASDSAYDRFQLGYIMVALLAFFTATTIFEIPHGALGLEMSRDYHERTRLFSAKSFLGNLFAMGTPWLFALAGLVVFRGPGGDTAAGMRYVSILIAAAMIPMTLWWFFALREPGFVSAREQPKSDFWQDMRTTVTNRTFLRLVAIIFTLAMGFNFVQSFNYYITIFYLYGGSDTAAGGLLGIAGTVWAITGLIAVFPLNWLSRRLGKSTTLLLAILLMCAAQLSKIVCYDPNRPYLVLIPTFLLSAGMLMFFTLGASMLGDVCDEDELHTGTRNEGSYFAVYWWFIKLGSAFASLVMGLLLESTGFDANQNVFVNSLQGDFAVLKSEAETWDEKRIAVNKRLEVLSKQLTSATENAEKLQRHLAARIDGSPEHSEHRDRLLEITDAVRSETARLAAGRSSLASSPTDVVMEADKLVEQTMLLKRQTPRTLFLLRFFEIGLPLVLSIVSIILTLRYPLTEARCYEIKEALKRRRGEVAN